MSSSSQISRFLDVFKKKHFCFAKLAGEMSLRWIMSCWGGRLAGNSSAGDMLCLAFLLLGICGCSIPTVVAEWLFCLHPPVGEIWGSYSEHVGAEVGGELLGLLGSAGPRLWFSTTLCALLVYSPLLSWPQHNALKFLLQAMENQETLEVHYSDDSGLAFVLL